ncbi:YutD family protein [Pediococcus claussenii]|uniref:Transcriptional regulator n=1 Tax=Pediococcus claussenii (strain ATCC BAA-344 / DSM 14800 / JCM 18046 / KCTC 3811 / LMG 21948 / P06) TaxID=701521 RepID=G8PCR2_PEDCP|nr:YutD family protein [Pediococcus claussenii]AEV95047.1 hypothetical protein PECL_756 [Pediococcus claussenii ATCC BAA-344]ANZ70236.1 hypothetical protein AYR57_07825 [Pediococcus claussenii]ANZ72052.1 hypothetical protein AYR58_07825 [Pediococcus claussenii]
MTHKTPEELEEMRRPSVNTIDRISENEIIINGHLYEILQNYREAFDVEQLADRFVNLFSRYDYIVGDVESNQLRLKGFYKDQLEVRNELKISSFQDYLYEVCGFGSPYFVLQNKDINERARSRWLKEQEKNKQEKKGSEVRHKESVNKRKNEFVKSVNKGKRRTFKIREKRGQK